MKIKIVGAGPSGSYTAYLLAKNGYDVEIFESNKPGIPFQCAGIVTKSIYNILNIPKSIVLNKIKNIVVKCNNNSVSIPSDDIVIDRIGFDKYLCELAIKHGAKLRNNSRVSKIVKNHIFIENVKPNCISYDILIGADGPKSIVSRYLGNDFKYYIGMQKRIIYKKNQSEYIVVFGNDFPNFFGWIVPEGNGIARVGTALYNNPKESLDKLISKYNKAKISDSQGGLIPIYNPKVKIQKDNIYVVGDAAGMVKATTGGGIVQGLLGAKALADSIIDKSNYSKNCKSLFKELKASLFIRNLLNKFDEKDYQDLINKINDKNIIQLLSKTTRDNPTKLVIKLFFKKPSLAKYGLKLFF